MKYYMVTLAGFWSDDSGSFNTTVWIKQDSSVFHYDSFRLSMIDTFGRSKQTGEIDDEMHIVIYFMREVTEFEYEVNNNETSPQSQ